MSSSPSTTCAFAQSVKGDRSEPRKGPDSNPTVRNTLYGLTLLVVAFFFRSYARQMVNLPFIDDFDSILEFLIRWSKSGSYSEKLGLLFAQHNEHRIVLTRIAALFSWKCFGVLDFRFLHTLGLVGVASLVPLIAYPLRTYGYFSLGVFSLSLLLCQPQPFEAYLWSTVSIASAYAIVFGIIAITYGLSDSCESAPEPVATIAKKSSFDRHLVYGATAATIGTYTQGNGMVVLPVVFLVLLLQRRWARAAFWAVVSGCILWAYFSGFANDPNNPGTARHLAVSVDIPLYAFNFIGASVSMQTLGVAVWCGTIPVLLLATYVGTGLAFRAPRIFGMALLVFGSVAINALGRSHLGAEYPVPQGRYLFYSILVWAVTVPMLLHLASEMRKTAVPAAISVLLCATFWIASNLFYGPKLDRFAAPLERGLNGWRAGNGVLAYPSDQQRPSSILREAIERGIFR